MRLPFIFYILPVLFSCTEDNNSLPDNFKSGETYIASTPANRQVKEFIGIPVLDSVDFIRWKLSFNVKEYKLSCHYGIGKPNTNDFINGGYRKEITGSWLNTPGERHLINGSKLLKLAVFNENLLHLLDGSENLMTGNGGWSYTLYKENGQLAGGAFVRTVSPTLPDSVAYEGRTPSGIPGIPAEPVYNRFKWYIVLYADNNLPTTYLAVSAPWRNNGGKTGNWRVVAGEQGKTIYQLLNDNGTIFLNLLRPDDNILLFMDSEERLLMGNKDFSYTLNRFF